MGITASWRRDCKRWTVTVRHEGKRRSQLAPKGMKKREALSTIGPALLAAMQGLTLPLPPADRAPAPPSSPSPSAERAPCQTLWQFCADVYQVHHELSDRTWRNRKYKVAALMSDLGHLRLDDVNTGVVADWLTRLADEGAPLRRGGRGKPLGKSAVNDHLVTLKAVYRVAYERHFIDEIPFRRRLQSVELMTNRQAWTQAMKVAVLEAAEADPGLHRIVRFLMLTGCRPIEALRLEWAHVTDVPKRSVLITGKGLRLRRLPITGELAELLDEIPRETVAVFPVERGPTAGQRYAVWPQKRWERVCAAAGVPSVVYDLRHTFITEQVVGGANPAKLAKWCGNSIRMIQERYAHLMPNHLISVARGAVLPKTSSRTSSEDAGPSVSAEDV